MEIINVFLKIAGKENFVIDSRIENSYIIRVCFKYFFMKLRGFAKALFNKNIHNSIFIGRNVKLLSKKNLSIGKKVKIHSGVKIDALSKEGVNIHDNVVIGENTIIECTGSLQQIGKGLEIGNNTSFSNNCFFGCAGGIKIGNDVIVGQYVRFHSENHEYCDKSKLIRQQGVIHQGIKIGNNCWIGSGAVFLDGAEVGDGCVVAANAVVNKKFEKNKVIGGIPARVIKER